MSGAVGMHLHLGLESSQALVQEPEPCPAGPKSGGRPETVEVKVPAIPQRCSREESAPQRGFWNSAEGSGVPVAVQGPGWGRGASFSASRLPPSAHCQPRSSFRSTVRSACGFLRVFRDSLCENSVRLN